MTISTLTHHLVRLGQLAAFALLTALALSACLPLQFGVERPSATSPAASATHALSTPLTTSVAAAPTATASSTPANGLTLTPSPTSASPTPGGAAATTAPSVTTPAPPTNTPRPGPTAVTCALTHTVQPGERLAQIGALYGVTWQSIASLNGLANPSLIFAGQVLCLPPNARLPNTPTLTTTPTTTASATTTPTITSTASPTADPCLEITPAPWFFTPTPPACATAPATTSQAAYQPFEHGQMVWLAVFDQYLILFDQMEGVSRRLLTLTGPLNLEPGSSPDNRVPETPPPGLEQPVSGFGIIWRGEPVGLEPLRPNLGWATQSEIAYTTFYQCEATPPTLWACYLRLPDGRILRLAFTPSTGHTWEEW